AGGTPAVRTVVTPWTMMKVAPVRTANIGSVNTAVAVARPVGITSVQVVLIPARNVMTRSAAPVCLIKPVPIASKNPWRLNMPRPKTQPLTRRLLQRPRRKRQKQRKRRPLRFSPYAMAKLIYLRDQGPTEVGGFGITEAADPKFVTDI